MFYQMHLPEKKLWPNTKTMRICCCLKREKGRWRVDNDLEMIRVFRDNAWWNHGILRLPFLSCTTLSLFGV